MFTQTLGQLFRSRPPETEVRAGAVYRRVGPGDVVETARVIDILDDIMDTPHVRYEVQVESARGKRVRFADQRILNLKTFAKEFVEASDA